MRSISAVLSSLLLCANAIGADIDLIGLFPGKAVLVVNGGAPKTYSVGATIADNVKLVAVDAGTATFEENGRRQTVAIGAHVNRAAPSGPASITLNADGHGHYFVNAQINGATLRMLVDTGASLIAMSSDDAMRMGIDYRKGRLAYATTANGVVPFYRVSLNSVRIGDITLNNVEAGVQESGLGGTALLGMSFLNRTEMRREGSKLTISKRY